MTVMNRTELEKLADHLIVYIRKKPEEYFDWKRLEAKLNLDREQLDAVLEFAASWDYKIRVRKKLGVAFIAPPDSLTATEISHKLATRWLGRNLFCYQAVKSTNDIAAEMSEQGAVEGTVITAEQQTRGRGRLGRHWHSPTGTGIYLSVLFRPNLRPDNAPGISIATAVALADTLEEYLPNDVRIKWPNDILIRGRKMAGILTELSAEGSRINHVIVGIGININQRAGGFPDEIKTIATSLRREVKRKVNRVELLQKFLKNLEKQYERYLIHRLEKSRAKLRRYSSLLGREITIRAGKSLTTGIARDIDADGCLILETAEGEVPIIAGEVTIVKK
ncbi:MAG: biotin--[acetyl-CoA-carboxylase] ligase [bacterium]|nr:biotin--[acetyl-CoA-carboxylase] ligase [bacterium]